MNGIHDLGGMQGFGPIEREENEPVFRADWERRLRSRSASVRHEARELWGDDAEPRDAVYIDLWEPYIACDTAVHHEFMKGSILDPAKVREAIKDVDEVDHLAALYVWAYANRWLIERRQAGHPLWPRLHGLTDRIGHHIAWRPTAARAGAPWVCGILSANNSTILSASWASAGSRRASSE